MAKNLLFKKLLLSLVVIFAYCYAIQGQTLFVENFDYSVGDLPLTPSSVWTSVNTGTAIQVKAGSLTYTGYLPGVANSITSISGLDYKSPLTSVTSGSVYAALLINVTSASAAGDYFFHFMESLTSTFYKGRIWLKQGTTSSKFYIGVAKSGTTPPVAYGATEYDCGTTYLLVIKYQINSGSSTDDVVTLYVNPDLGGTEPGSATVTASDNTTTDGSSISMVALRQGSATSAPNLTIDGIRVAASWTDAISDILAPVPTFNPVNGAIDVLTTATPSITFNEKILKTDGTPVLNSDLPALITFKKSDATGADVAFTSVIDAFSKIISVTPSSPLANSQLYYLAVGPVKDEYGNQSVVKSSTFTTIAAATPTLSLTYPVGGERMYSGDLKTITWTSTNFDIAESVKIEVWAIDGLTGLYEWITLIASTPNDGSHEVTVGPDAPYGTEYVIRISGVINGITDSSDPFTIIATAANLQKLRSNRENSIIKYTGTATVTYSRTANNQKYIQDATAAVLVHDPTGFISGTYNIGDGIKNIEGKITYYNGLIELVPTVATGETATGTPIVPEVRTMSSLTAEDQCKLVKVEKVKFANPAQWDAGSLYVTGKNYDLTGYSSSNYAYRTAFSESDYIGQPVPASYFNAIVLVGQFNTQMQITARNNADITLLSGAKAITSFAFTTPATTGTIDETGKTVSLAVPSGTIVTALVPTVAVSPKATISPASGTAQDFTSPVNYTVTAEDGTTQVYVVSVSFLTGIEKGTDRNMVIYPVPAASILNVKNIGSVTTIEILDVTGKIVIRMDDVNQNEVKIPVSNLRKGMYFIKLTTPEGKVIRRFIKS